MFPRTQPFGSDDFSSRGKVYSRHVTGSVKLWDLVSVLCHEVLSDFNCFQESCISTNLYHSILLWNPFHSFLVLFAINFLVREFQSKVWVSLSIILLARTMSQIVLPTRVSSFFFDRYRIPHTHLRLLRRYWADWQKMILRKNSFNRFTIGTGVYR